MRRYRAAPFNIPADYSTAVNCIPSSDSPLRLPLSISFCLPLLSDFLSLLLFPCIYHVPTRDQGESVVLSDQLGSPGSFPTKGILRPQVLNPTPLCSNFPSPSSPILLAVPLPEASFLARTFYPAGGLSCDPSSKATPRRLQRHFVLGCCLASAVQRSLSDRQKPFSLNLRVFFCAKEKGRRKPVNHSKGEAHRQ